MILDASLQQFVDRAHQAGKKIVLATGVFDLLHAEHKRFLAKAKEAGDVLIVGLESDVRVRQLKGPTRPINNQQLRKQQIEELGVADAVFLLPDDFGLPAQHQALIAEMRPAILAVSSHSPHQDKKAALMEKYGGQLVVVHQHNPEISTTILAEQQK